MRALAYDASAYNASICECAHSHRMRTHFSCVMRAFAYVVWASSVSVMRAYARIRMRCERIRIACARIRIACARIACECAHLRGTYACPVLYIYTKLACYHVFVDFTHIVMVPSLVLQSHDCPSANKATLKNMGQQITWIFRKKI